MSDSQGIRLDRPITFYTYALSPFAMKVYWALIFKGVPFEQVYVGLKRPETAFTSQNKIPVLKIGDEWKQDSTEVCLWLEQKFPERAFFSTDEEEQQRILNANQWVTDYIIGATFRLTVDRAKLCDRLSNGRVYARVLNQTSGGVPAGAKFIWGLLGRRVDWVWDHARATMHYDTVESMNCGIVADMEQMLADTGYLAGTKNLSFADLAAYAQIIVDEPLGFKSRPDYFSSKAIVGWLQRVQGQLPDIAQPELVPGLELPVYKISDK